jgi:hypothetical protein
MNAILNTPRALAMEPPLCPPDDESDEDECQRAQGIRLAMETLARASAVLEAQLADPEGPSYLRVDALMAEAANYLIGEHA